MKILLIAGHGEGDCGAVGCGFQEAEKTRELMYILNPLLAQVCECVSYDYTKNCYKQSKAGKAPDWKCFDYVIELHFNAFNKSANGTEIYIDESEIGKEVEEKIVKYISEIGFKNRGVQRKNNLLNMNLCTNAGTSYCLIETCFIDSNRDMTVYETNKQKVAEAILRGVVEGFGLNRLDASRLWKVFSCDFKSVYEADSASEIFKSKGFVNFKIVENGFYKLQCGCFEKPDNAYLLHSQLEKAGLDTYVKRV